MLHWAENFISIHLRNGYDYMNQNTINQFIKEKDEQRYKGEIGQEHYRKWKRIIERFVLFAYTGEIGMLPNVNIGPTQELSTQLSHKQFPAIRNTYNEKQEEKRKIDIQAGKQFAETTLIKSGRKRL